MSSWIALPEGLQGGVERVQLWTEREVQLSLWGVATEHEEVGAEAELSDEWCGAGLKEAGEEGGQGFWDQGMLAGLKEVQEGVWARAVRLPGQCGGDIPRAREVGGESVQDGLIQTLQLSGEVMPGHRDPGASVAVWGEGEMRGTELEVHLEWGGAQASRDSGAFGGEALPELDRREGEWAV